MAGVAAASRRDGRTEAHSAASLDGSGLLETETKLAPHTKKRTPTGLRKHRPSLAACAALAYSGQKHPPRAAILRIYDTRMAPTAGRRKTLPKWAVNTEFLMKLLALNTPG
jgi:hypothetical protein